MKIVGKHQCYHRLNVSEIETTCSKPLRDASISNYGVLTVLRSICTRIMDAIVTVLPSLEIV
jgi:hypothetical protein